MENDKIKASHILMHNESKDSRSDISKDKAKKVYIPYTKT